MDCNFKPLNNTCLIRCEYSESVGFGHLMRCLALAQELDENGYKVCVFSANGKPNINSQHLEVIDQWLISDHVLGSLADARGLALMAKGIRASLLILDFYNISEGYQMLLRNMDFRWMQFNGLAKHNVWADWVVSMSPAASMDEYTHLSRNFKTHFLLGPKYAILRPEFRAYRDIEKEIEDVKQVLISFGGGDDHGMTLFCLNALKTKGWGGKVYVVVGHANPNIDKISLWINMFGGESVYLSVDEPNMAKVMSESDMAVISGGMTTFEVAVLGIPTMMLYFADNQRPNVEAWNHLGLAIDLGDSSELTESRFCRCFMSLVEDRSKRQTMSQRSMKIVDGLGVERVVRQLLGREHVHNA